METTSRTCRRVQRRLPLLVGGELMISDRRKVERHLIGCVACRDRRAALEQSLLFLRAAGTSSIGESPSVWPALSRQIRESRHQPACSSVLVRAGAWGQRHARVAIGAGLAASLLLALAWNRGSSRPPAIAMNPTTDRLARNPVAPPSESQPTPLAAADAGELATSPLDTFDVPVVQRDPRPSALPGDELVPKPMISPFKPPLTLRFDFDLERGTVAVPVARDTQRAL